MGVSSIQSFRELQEAGAKKKNPFFVHELSIGFDKQFDDQSGKGGGVVLQQYYYYYYFFFCSL